MAKQSDATRPKRTIDDFFGRPQTSTVQQVGAKRPRSSDTPASSPARPFQNGFFANTTKNQPIINQSAKHTAIQPFKAHSHHLCPFATLGLCGYASEHYPTFALLVYHIKSVHGPTAIAVPLSANPLEDGTEKIPCPSGCGTMFPRYQLASQHAKRPNECPIRSTDQRRLCPWSKYTGCQFASTDRSAMANHNRTHLKDSRGPYQCSKGCGEYHADLYVLAAHEEKCKSTDVKATQPKASSGSLRFTLTQDAENKPPAIILIARSSSVAPQGWRADTGSIVNGLPIWGKGILDQFLESGGQAGAAVLHAAYETKSCDVPAPKSTDPLKDKNEGRRRSLKRALQFTKAITADIKTANREGITPTLVSVGLDGWACDTDMITKYLDQEPNLSFTLVLRLPELIYGLSSRHARSYNHFWWASYSSDRIRDRLDKGTGADEAIENLISAWDQLQGRKDTRAQNTLKVGRNILLPAKSK